MADEDKTKSPFYCAVCETCMNCEKAFQTHIDGARHKQNLQRSVAGVPLVKNRKSAAAAGKKESAKWDRPIDPELKPNNLRDSERPIPEFVELARNCNEPLIGLEYITEFQVFDKSCMPRYECHLCEFTLATKSVLAHILGFKHRARYVKATNTGLYELLKGKKKEDLGEFANLCAADIQTKEGKKHVIVKMESVESWKKVMDGKKETGKDAEESQETENDGNDRKQRLSTIASLNFDDVKPEGAKPFQRETLSDRMGFHVPGGRGPVGNFGSLFCGPEDNELPLEFGKKFPPNRFDEDYNEGSFGERDFGGRGRGGNRGRGNDRGRGMRGNNRGRGRGRGNDGMGMGMGSEESGMGMESEDSGMGMRSFGNGRGFGRGNARGRGMGRGNDRMGMGGEESGMGMGMETEESGFGSGRGRDSFGRGMRGNSGRGRGMGRGNEQVGMGGEESGMGMGMGMETEESGFGSGRGRDSFGRGMRGNSGRGRGMGRGNEQVGMGGEESGVGMETDESGFGSGRGRDSFGRGMRGNSGRGRGMGRGNDRLGMGVGMGSEELETGNEESGMGMTMGRDEFGRGIGRGSDSFGMGMGRSRGRGNRFLMGLGEEDYMGMGKDGDDFGRGMSRDGMGMSRGRGMGRGNDGRGGGRGMGMERDRSPMGMGRGEDTGMENAGLGGDEWPKRKSRFEPEFDDAKSWDSGSSMRGRNGARGGRGRGGQMFNERQGGQEFDQDERSGDRFPRMEGETDDKFSSNFGASRQNFPESFGKKRKGNRFDSLFDRLGEQRPNDRRMSEPRQNEKREQEFGAGNRKEFFDEQPPRPTPPRAMPSPAAELNPEDEARNKAIRRMKTDLEREEIPSTVVLSLLLKHADKMITNEEEASVALSASNALTQSVLTYRLKHVPKGVLAKQNAQQNSQQGGVQSLMSAQQTSQQGGVQPLMSKQLNVGGKKDGMPGAKSGFQEHGQKFGQDPTTQQGMRPGYGQEGQYGQQGAHYEQGGNSGYGQHGTNSQFDQQATNSPYGQGANTGYDQQGANAFEQGTGYEQGGHPGYEQSGYDQSSYEHGAQTGYEHGAGYEQGAGYDESAYQQGMNYDYQQGGMDPNYAQQGATQDYQQNPTLAHHANSFQGIDIPKGLDRNLLQRVTSQLGQSAAPSDTKPRKRKSRFDQEEPAFKSEHQPWPGYPNVEHLQDRPSPKIEFSSGVASSTETSTSAGATSYPNISHLQDRKVPDEGAPTSSVSGQPMDSVAPSSGPGTVTSPAIMATAANPQNTLPSTVFTSAAGEIPNAAALEGVPLPAHGGVPGAPPLPEQPMIHAPLPGEVPHFMPAHHMPQTSVLPGVNLLAMQGLRFLAAAPPPPPPGPPAGQPRALLPLPLGQAPGAIPAGMVPQPWGGWAPAFSSS